MIRPMVSWCSAYLSPVVYLATMPSRAAPCAACSAETAPPPGAGTRSANWSRKSPIVSSGMGTRPPVRWASSGRAVAIFSAHDSPHTVGRRDDRCDHVTISAMQPGRPRDPDVDRRVADAAVALFGEAGWAGFSMEAVARRAGVGKASIYLRWQAKEDLLAEALRRRIGMIADVDTGTLR